MDDIHTLDDLYSECITTLEETKYLPSFDSFCTHDMLRSALQLLERVFPDMTITHAIYIFDRRKALIT